MSGLKSTRQSCPKLYGYWWILIIWGRINLESCSSLLSFCVACAAFWKHFHHWDFFCVASCDLCCNSLCSLQANGHCQLLLISVSLVAANINLQLNQLISIMWSNRYRLFIALYDLLYGWWYLRPNRILWILPPALQELNCLKTAQFPTSLSM